MPRTLIDMPFASATISGAGRAVVCIDIQYMCITIWSICDIFDPNPPRGLRGPGCSRQSTPLAHAHRTIDRSNGGAETGAQHSECLIWPCEMMRTKSSSTLSTSHCSGLSLEPYFFAPTGVGSTLYSSSSACEWSRRWHRMTSEATYSNQSKVRSIATRGGSYRGSTPVFELVGYRQASARTKGFPRPVVERTAAHQPPRVCTIDSARKEVDCCCTALIFASAMAHSKK